MKPGDRPVILEKEMTMSNQDRNRNGGNGRRQFLKCMAWAGTGVVWAMRGGVLRAETLDAAAGSNFDKSAADNATFSFVQISDSHIGFNKAPNPDVIGTLKGAIAQINALAERPAFVLHTGDLTHLAHPESFDIVSQITQDIKTGRIFFIPGEHDVLGDDGKEYFSRFGKGNSGNGWYSFDYRGVHFIGLINVLNLKPGGMGSLGQEQIEWLEKDLAGRSNSTPIVVFAHMPLWNVYEPWGWGTGDSAQALSHLRRFGSVTVLNGHIHQIQQKVEGNITFYTARSTGFPQPAPGAAPAPGPLQNVQPSRLHSLLGIRDVRAVRVGGPLAVTDNVLT
ncbi:MAG TPA: metallophosphoesterase [Gammaproteobacteria bacterium]|nr:metallophosphoesterase [Gammaproteobacteria bacterium]